MGKLLVTRVQERLATLGINRFEAARMAGFERSFFNDLLIEKKSTLRESNLAKVAQALDCDAEYLIGVQDIPRRAAKPIRGFKISGVCEAGVWRSGDSRQLDFAEAPIHSDPRHHPSDQAAYYVRDDHALGLGIAAHSIVIVVSTSAVARDGGKIRHGDVVLVRRTDADGKEELSVRVVEDKASGLRLHAKGVPWTSPGYVDEGRSAAVIGLVLRSDLIFGYSP